MFFTFTWSVSATSSSCPHYRAVTSQFSCIKIFLSWSSAAITSADHFLSTFVAMSLLETIQGMRVDGKGPCTIQKVYRHDSLPWGFFLLSLNVLATTSALDVCGTCIWCHLMAAMVPSQKTACGFRDCLPVHCSWKMAIPITPSWCTVGNTKVQIPWLTYKQDYRCKMLSDYI